jgi:hypothetical protein
MWQRIERARIEAKPDAIWRVIADIANHHKLAGSGEVRSVTLDGPVEAGTWFTSEIDVGEVRAPFVSRNRIDVVKEPLELRWTSYPPLDPGETELHQLEISWWFKLTAGKGETLVEHGFRLPKPRAGAAELASFLDRHARLQAIGAGMQRTLVNVRVAAGA